MLKKHNELLPEKQQGIYRKFIVQRVDGRDKSGFKHDGCEYFVLDLTHDKYAHAALAAYARACENEYPKLAEDLLRKIQKTK